MMTPHSETNLHDSRHRYVFIFIICTILVALALLPRPTGSIRAPFPLESWLDFSDFPDALIAASHFPSLQIVIYLLTVNLVFALYAGGSCK